MTGKSRESLKERITNSRGRRNLSPAVWNYDICRLNLRDVFETAAAAGAVSAVVAWAFYDSAAVFAVLFVPCFYFLLRNRRKTLPLKRQALLKKQFLTAAVLLGDYLKSGHSVETAIRSSVSELAGIWGEDADIVREWKRMDIRLSLNRPPEEVFGDFAERSGIGPIMDFSEVFRSVNRGSGQLGGVIANVTALLSEQFHTEDQIETMIAAKKYEQKIMNLIPAGIILYIRIASPELLEPMYTGLTGRLIMSGCLLIYAFSVFWAAKISDIRV